MKKSLLAIAAVFAMNIAIAQTNTTPTDYGNNAPLSTPSTLTSKFNSDYPNNNPTWTMDDGYYRAQYRDVNTNTDRYITYDKDGNVIVQGDRVMPDKYPAPINEYYTKTYPNQTITEVWSSTDKKGNTTYYTRNTTETLWFDKDGKYYKTTKVVTKTKKTTK
jgi:hypothetical protein